MTSVRRGREVEAKAVTILEAQGYVVHRCIRNGVKRNGRWYSAGNDIWGCVDIQAKRRGERVRFIQVTSDTGIGKKRLQLEAVPWDSAWECVEIWRWVERRAGVAAHFQRYLLEEGYELDPSNRIFPRQQGPVPTMA
ncbi:MAG TPA: hypothetical protein VM327_02950 [Candidatus Thermoplasmatota archaeon]|nr:hypothetical protein [Candidatus Thermoplasmatota archaeon]